VRDTTRQFRPWSEQLAGTGDVTPRSSMNP
jgi:hypothetical protein